MVSLLIFSVSFAILVSALCSLFEAVLYSLPVGHIELLRKKKPATAKLLKKLKSNIEEPISAILTLNTLSHTVGAAVAGAAAVSVFGEKNLVWFSLLFTLAILIFSEILPKTAGVVYARFLGPYIATPLNLMIISLRPFIWMCRIITNLIPQSKMSHLVSAEELQAIAILSRKTGEIEVEQEQVITNILKLGDQTVRDVMTPRTVTFSLDQNMTIKEAAELKDKWKIHSRAPVYHGEPDNVVGIALSKDVFMALADNENQKQLHHVMRPVNFVPESAPLNRILIEFFERHQHLFVVVDEYGSVTGVISLEDIFEEIIGREIIDESDKTMDMRELARAKRKKINQNKD